MGKSEQTLSETMKLAFLASTVAATELIQIPISPDNGEISESNLVASDVTIYKSWELSVDLKMGEPDEQKYNSIVTNILSLGGLDVDMDFNSGLVICNSAVDIMFITKVEEHCWFSEGVPDDWFTLKIRQKPKMYTGLQYPWSHKTHESNLDYNYQVVFDGNADEFSEFKVDADFNHGATIGFSDQQTHDSMKIEIVLGGWTGTRSVIRSGNQGVIEADVGHSAEEFDAFKHDLRVVVNDGIVQVFKTQASDAEPFMEWKSETIVKAELTNLLVTGGYQGSGSWKIDGRKIQNTPPPRTWYEIYIDGELMEMIENHNPKVWRNVNAEIAGTSDFIEATVGAYKNFSLKTWRSLESVEDGILNLQVQFAQILSDSELRERVQNKHVKLFNKASNSLLAFYESMRDHKTKPCSFPAKWEEKVEINHGSDECEAVEQTVAAVEEWGKTFVFQCNSSGRVPYTMLNRVMKKMNKRVNRLLAKMNDNCEAA